MEEKAEHDNPELEGDNQDEEEIKIFDNKYDFEFIGLLNEIGIRLENFSKYDILKIKSWINILTIPCDSNDMKKNRNLYGIKLLNQMINGKLEDPFTRYANDLNDLIWLSSIDIKAELGKKFFEEIDIENIENFGMEQQKKFLNNHPDIANKIKLKNLSNSESNIPENGDNFVNINEKPFATDYNEAKFLPEEEEYMKRKNDEKMRSYNKKANKNKICDFQIFKVNNDRLKKVKNYKEKIKLINIIRDLEQKIVERDEIIEFQKKQIEQIQNRINYLQNLKYINQKK